jgi:hypothetical protein
VRRGKVLLLQKMSMRASVDIWPDLTSHTSLTQKILLSPEQKDPRLDDDDDSVTTMSSTTAFIQTKTDLMNLYNIRRLDRGKWRH